MVQRVHSNDLKIIIIELLQSGRSLKELIEKYDLDRSMIVVHKIKKPTR
ncbi:hypothetical protein [Aquimarina longa]|nr:hypothetical protein [Aquimarina longa]